MNDIIFYFGTVIIIGIFIWFLFIKFKNEDEINLKEHFWIIILYILLIVAAIITWRIIYLIIISNSQKIINYNNLIQRVNNG